MYFDHFFTLTDYLALWSPLQVPRRLLVALVTSVVREDLLAACMFPHVRVCLGRAGHFTQQPPKQRENMNFACIRAQCCGMEAPLACGDTAMSIMKPAKTAGRVVRYSFSYLPDVARLLFHPMKCEMMIIERSDTKLLEAPLGITFGVNR